MTYWGRFSMGHSYNALLGLLNLIYLKLINLYEMF